MRKSAALAGLWLGMGIVASHAQDQRLEIRWDLGFASPRLSAETAPDRVVELEAATDLDGWHEIARTHQRLLDYPDLGAVPDSARFYRARFRPRVAADDWKNQIGFFDEPLRSPASPEWDPESRWVKFAILSSNPHRVYFQDSTKYPFHYEFAVARLPGFAGMSRLEFDLASLRTNQQQIVLGAVLFAPRTNTLELGIQFAGLDPFPPERIAAWYQAVGARIAYPLEAGLFYFPTFEQSDTARQHEAWFAARGIRIGAATRWIVGDECYAPGWALGRLVYVPAAEITAAYRDGRLTVKDVLLTDAVPAEVPPVSGVVALTPATPNSHVAILAQSFGIPFVYFAEAGARETLATWTGRTILLRAIVGFEGCQVLAAALDGSVDPALEEEILALKEPPTLDIPRKQTYGAFHRTAEDLEPDDIVFVGGKAANFGLLRRAIPEDSPSPAMAFTFDLWDAYLDQAFPGGGTLRDAIAARLAGFTWPPNAAALETALAEIREWITDLADFSPQQETLILQALLEAGFAPDRNIRFRSSTNVEDSEQFTGAGLYDSYSGCLADDLDTDDTGPSLCDPTETRERGVFRAMRKVYASFYNHNAFLERLRHRIPETDVGMALLVHHSTPDEFELANGVATLEIRKDFGRVVDASLVTQAGAVSVANPETTARPERVRLTSYGPSPELIERSSLVQLGATVLVWERDYQTLYGLLDAAATAYESVFPAKSWLILDFEYKKVTPGRLRVKQIREIPRPEASTTVPVYLMATTNILRVLEGEFGDLMALHRLKSEWQLETRHSRLEVSSLQTSLFQRVTARLLDGTNRLDLDAPMSALPNYRFTALADETRDAWTLGQGPEQRQLELRLWYNQTRQASEGPLVVLWDLPIEFHVRYATPQPTLGYIPRFTNTLEETVFLTRPSAPTAESLPQERLLEHKAATVRTRFYWPPPPTGPSAGYTAPVQAWIDTEITGLTSSPVLLQSDLSQTYHPGHHNFYEEFLFDPWLEPELDPARLDELAAANIRALIVLSDDQTTEMIVWGLDGKFREL